MKKSIRLMAKWAVWLLSLGLLTSCGAPTSPSGVSSPAATSAAAVTSGAETTASHLDESSNRLLIKVKDFGDIHLELYPEAAPLTVENFKKLVAKGFYDGLSFHRIVPGFVIQGGDPKGDGSGGPGYSIKGEFKANGVDNPLKHTKGVLSMARTNDPDSAGSQFFIMLGDADYLDGQYAAFGKVVAGMEVAEKIAAVSTSAVGQPIQAVVIERICFE